MSRKGFTSSIKNYIYISLVVEQSRDLDAVHVVLPRHNGRKGLDPAEGKTNILESNFEDLTLLG